MHALVVTAHPDPASFTRAVTDRLVAGLATAPGQTVEMADLAAEGFDPRFTLADLAQFRRQAATEPAILAEQRRLDRADLLVLAYPVYWWSMPALMKGWIDRVFIQGWAFDERPDGRILKQLGRLRVQLVGIGGADAGTYARRGYAEAMRIQIEQGIFGYCGAPVVGSDLLLHTDAASRQQALQRGFAIGQGLAQTLPAARAG